MSDKLTYTKAIKNGKLRATQMEIGASVTGVLQGFNEGKDFGKGPTLNPVLEVNGQNVEIFPAGNLKFLEKDVSAGKKNLGDFLIITRVENKEYKGYPVSQFTMTVQGSTSNTATTVAVAASTASVKEKLAAIQAKRTTN